LRQTSDAMQKRGGLKKHQINRVYQLTNCRTLTPTSLQPDDQIRRTSISLGIFSLSLLGRDASQESSSWKSARERLQRQSRRNRALD